MEMHDLQPAGMRQNMKCAVLWNTVKRWNVRNVMIFKLASVIDERKKRMYKKNAAGPESLLLTCN